MPEEDLRLGKLALAKGLITGEQMREALEIQHRIQSEMGVSQKLGDILVARGMLAAEQVAELLGEQKKRTRREIGAFELISRLGAGGMGAVYKARQKSMDRLVALKVLQPRLAKNREFISRFFREARAAGKLAHTNIVGGIDVGEADGYHYFAMEYVEGASVAARIGREGALPVGDALEIAVQTARGLSYAHRHGIIHRDVKPDNIMVTADGTAKICDLGLARSTQGEDQTLTQTGMAVGTPHYIAPEQAKGERRLDARTDIYALGATLYHMLAGAPPFSGESIAVVLMKHMTEMPRPLDEVRPEVPHALACVVQKMLEKDPDARYSSCEALIADLEAARAGAAVSAPEPAIGLAPEIGPTVRYQAPSAPGLAPPLAPPLPTPEPAPAPQAAALRPAFLAGALVAAAGVLIIGLLLRRRGGEDPPEPGGPAGPEGPPGLVEPPPDQRPPGPPPESVKPPGAEERVERAFHAAEEYAAKHPEDFETILQNYREIQALAREEGLLEYTVRAREAMARIEEARAKAAQAALAEAVRRAEKLIEEDRPLDPYRFLLGEISPEQRAMLRDGLRKEGERLRGLRSEHMQKRLDEALRAAEEKRFDEAHGLLERAERAADVRERARVAQVRRRIEALEGEAAVRARREREEALDRFGEAWKEAMRRRDLKAAEKVLDEARRLVGDEPPEEYEDARRVTELTAGFGRAVLEGIERKRGKVIRVSGITGRLGGYDAGKDAVALDLRGAGSMSVPLARLTTDERLRLADCADPAKVGADLALAAAAYLLFDAEAPDLGRIKLYLAAAERGGREGGFVRRMLEPGEMRPREPGDRPWTDEPEKKPEREMHFDFVTAESGRAFMENFDFIRLGRGQRHGKVGPGGMQVTLSDGQWIMVVARRGWYGRACTLDADFAPGKEAAKTAFGFLLTGRPERPGLMLRVDHDRTKRALAVRLGWHASGRMSNVLAEKRDSKLFRADGLYSLVMRKEDSRIEAELNGSLLFSMEVEKRIEPHVREERLTLFAHAPPGGGERQFAVRELHAAWPPGGQLEHPPEEPPRPPGPEPREPPPGEPPHPEEPGPPWPPHPPER